MNERNPYAPPAAPVADIDRAPGAAAPAPFFAVSVLKFVVMTVVTLGIYELYWQYKNWKLIKDQDGRNIMPLWRAFFALFFVYALFKEVRDYDHPSNNEEKELPAGPLAAGWIILTLLWRLPDPYSWISFFAFLFVVPVQVRVNRINTAVDPEHDPNSRFTVWNWIGVALGVAFICLAIVGSLLPNAEGASR